MLMIPECDQLLSCSWAEHQADPIFVALTENRAVESWTEEAAVEKINNRDFDGITVMELSDYKWAEEVEE